MNPIKPKLAIFLDHLLEAARQEGITPDDALTRVRLLGYEGLEVTHDPDMDAYALANRFMHAGFFVSTLCVRMDFANHPEDMRLALSALDQCCALGAQNYLAIPGMIDLNDPARAQVQRENMVAGLSILCEHAKKRGVTVVMEDYDSAASPYATAQGVRFFMDRVPELRVAFDTGNFAFSDEDELAAFDLLKDRIAHVHLKDRALYTADPTERPTTTLGGRKLYACPFGYGITKGDEILRRLMAMNYQGVLTVEHYGTPRQLHYMERSIAYVNARIR